MNVELHRSRSSRWHEHALVAIHSQYDPEVLDALFRARQPRRCARGTRPSHDLAAGAMSFFRRKPKPEPPPNVYTTKHLLERMSMTDVTVGSTTDPPEVQKMRTLHHCGRCDAAIPLVDYNRDGHRCSPPPLTAKQQRRKQEWERRYTATMSPRRTTTCELCQVEWSGERHWCPGYPPTKTTSRTTPLYAEFQRQGALQLLKEAAGLTEAPKDLG